MASDDEFDDELPQIPKKLFDRYNVDSKRVNQKQDIELEFSVPDVVETESVKNEKKTSKEPELPIFMDTPTYDRMTLKIWNVEDREKMSVIMGDFSEIEQLMQNVLSDGSLKKLIIKPGTGKKVMEGNLVTVHFIVSVEDMDDVLQSTFKDRYPKRFRVGKGEVLPMMDLGVQTMRVGEVSKFLGDYKVAYGELGVPLLGGKVVPAKSRVLVQLEVLDSQTVERDDTIAALSPAERKDLGFEKLYQYAYEVKADGNQEFKDGDYDAAIIKYREAMGCTKDMEDLIMSPEQTKKYTAVSQDVLNNLAHAYLKLEKPKSAAKYAQRSAEFEGVNNRNAKANYLWAKALYQLGRYKESEVRAKKADDLKWEDKDIKDLLLKVQRKIKTEAESERLLCERMVKASLK